MWFNCKYKKQILIFFSMAALPAFILVVSFYIYDPMMQFHKPWGRDVHLHSNMRLQAAGIIRNSGKSSYILGTSMLENSSADEASKALGEEFANISMSGSNFYERSFPLRLALEKGASRIIYSVDQAYFGREKGRKKYPEENFTYLYESGLERIKLYFQHKFIFCLVRWSESSLCIGNKKSYDMPNAWADKPANQRRFGGLDNWLSARNSRQVINALNGIVSNSKSISDGKYFIPSEDEIDTEIAKSIKYVDTYILQYVIKYPNTKFELIFPPYSRIRFAEWHQLHGQKAKIHEAVIRHLAQSASGLDNLNVYGYEDQDFLDDISNYKDTGHYDQWVNEMFIENIVDGKNRITVDNVDNYLKISREKALSFDMVELGRKIEGYLSKL